MTDDISGYTFGEESVPVSPIDMPAFNRLKQTVLFTEEDEEHLRMAGEVLDGQIDDVLDTWYEFIADHPHLIQYFSTPEGEPIEEYLDRVRQRFGQWIRDTCNPPYDEEWLNYQQEIALRHTHEKKNETDDVDSVDHIPYRYLSAFIYPITATMKPFLKNGKYSGDAVEKMHSAWFKAVVLQVTLWSEPYVKNGDF
ncbi:protoglobin domain-containing protein [Haladaptatus pallidirubidus]|uniref:Protoglobin domain-containing protein n=1 Tax=Haladaptatus pallidirubidus TaxID=1008152 RepID=A0AAV3UG81_9EURY|nr:protoglobin domain-containing protein [Haladaptatus pallidirubidus]